MLFLMFLVIFFLLFYFYDTKQSDYMLNIIDMQQSFLHKSITVASNPYASFD